MPTMSPYRPLSPVGSPDFPIEPRASTLPAPRPPPRRPMSPGRSPHAALDFLTEVGREGAGRQLLTGGALNAARSVNRDEALEIDPMVQAQRQQQLNAMLEQVRSLRNEFAPEAVKEPGEPEVEGFVEWGRKRYPQLARRRLIDPAMLAALRKEYMAEQAAKLQVYDTQMRGYGSQIRGRRGPGDPAALMKQLAPYHPPGVDPAIRRQKLEDRAAKQRRDDVVTKGERAFKREQAEAGRAHDITLAGIKKPAVMPEKLSREQALVRAITAKDWETVDNLIKRFPEPKGAAEKEKLALLRQQVAMLNGIMRSRGDFDVGTPQSRVLQTELERTVGEAFGIDVTPPVPGALDRVGEEMREGGAAPALAPPSAPPADRINEMAEWYWSLSDEEKKLFSAQVKKGRGGG